MKMIEFNDEHEQIEIKEFFSFSNHVLPIFNDILDELKYDDEQVNNKTIQKLLNYQLTHKDKMDILHAIEDEYERKLNYFDTYCNVSIFDEETIKECLMNWISDNFDIEFNN